MAFPTGNPAALLRVARLVIRSVSWTWYRIPGFIRAAILNRTFQLIGKKIMEKVNADEQTKKELAALAAEAEAAADSPESTPAEKAKPEPGDQAEPAEPAQMEAADVERLVLLIERGLNEYLRERNPALAFSDAEIGTHSKLTAAVVQKYAPKAGPEALLLTFTAGMIVSKIPAILEARKKK